MTIPRELVSHIFAALFGIFIIAPVLFLVFDSSPCVEITRARMEPNVVQSGGTVRIIWQASGKQRCEGYIIRRFIDSSNVIYETVRDSVVYREPRAGQTEITSVLITIPQMPPGPAIYAPVVYRWRNPIQQMWPTREVIQPIKFTVTVDKIKQLSGNKD